MAGTSRAGVAGPADFRQVFYECLSVRRSTVETSANPLVPIRADDIFPAHGEETPGRAVHPYHAKLTVENDDRIVGRIENVIRETPVGAPPGNAGCFEAVTVASLRLGSGYLCVQPDPIVGLPHDALSRVLHEPHPFQRAYTLLGTLLHRRDSDNFQEEELRQLGAGPVFV